MAEKGIIIDVGFRGEYKKFIDEIEQEFQSLDFSKSINLSKTFSEQEKEVRDKLQKLKKLMDEVLGGNVSDTPKQLASMQSAVLHLSKAVKDMMVNANPADIEKFGGAISEITNDIDNLTTSCSNAQNMISELSKNQPVKFVDEDQGKELRNQYKLLKSVVDELKDVDKAKYKSAGKAYEYGGGFSEDVDKVADELSRAYESYNEALNKLDELEDKTDISNTERAKAQQKYWADTLHSMIEIKRYAKTVESWGPKAKKEFEFFEISDEEEEYPIKIRDVLEEISEEYSNVQKKILQAQQEIKSSAKQIGVDLEEVFSKSVSKNENEPLKIPIALDTTYGDLKGKVNDLIDRINKDTTITPIKIEITPVSNYFNEKNRKRLEDFRKRFESLGTSETLEKQFEDFINKWDNDLDNSLLFNVYINTAKANEQIKEFVQKAKTELKGIQTIVTFTPEMVVKENAKEQVEKQLNELFENVSVVADIQKLTTELKPREEIKEINMGDIIKPATRTATKNIEAERLAIEKINTELDNVIEKITQKTDAFITEDSFVQEVTGDEIACLSRLYDDLGLIQQQVLDIAESFQNLPSNLTLGLDINGINTETANVIQSISEARNTIINATGQQVANTLQLSDEEKNILLQEISAITDRMNEMFDSSAIINWSKEFGSALEKVQTDITDDIFNTFQGGFDDVKKSIDEIKEKFNSLSEQKSQIPDLFNIISLEDVRSAFDAILSDIRAILEIIPENGISLNNGNVFTSNIDNELVRLYQELEEYERKADYYENLSKSQKKKTRSRSKKSETSILDDFYSRLDKTIEEKNNKEIKTVCDKVGNTLNVSNENKEELSETVQTLIDDTSKLLDIEKIAIWQNTFNNATETVNVNVTELFNTFRIGFEDIIAGINQVKDTFSSMLGTNQVSNKLAEIIDEWTEADKMVLDRFKDVEDSHLRERETGFNTKTGYVFNSHLQDEHNETSYADYITRNKRSNSVMHSHPELASFFSVTDLSAFETDAINGITDQFLKNIYNVLHFRFDEFFDSISDLSGNTDIDLPDDFYDDLKAFISDRYKKTTYTYMDFFSDLFDNINLNEVFPSLNISKQDFISEIKSVFSKRGFEKSEAENNKAISDALQSFFNNHGLSNQDTEILSNIKNIDSTVYQLNHMRILPDVLKEFGELNELKIPDIREFFDVYSINEFKEKFGKSLPGISNTSLFGDFKSILDGILQNTKEIVQLISSTGITVNASPSNKKPSKKGVEQNINADEEAKKYRDLAQNTRIKIQQYIDSEDYNESVNNIEDTINSLETLNQEFLKIKNTIEEITVLFRDNLASIADYGNISPTESLSSAFNEYKKFYDANDLESEAGAKAALRYLDAYKNALYSKVNKKDLKEYTIGGTDKYFTGNYKKYSSQNGTIKDLDLSGIESEISRYKDILVNSTGIPTLLESFQNELKEMFTLPENAEELNTFLGSLKESLVIPEGSNSVSNALNTLKKSLDSLTNSKADGKIEKLFETIDKIIERVQSLNGEQGIPFVQNLNDILSKKDELKDLVEILKASAKQIKATEKNVKSEENYKKATELLSDNSQGITNAVMKELGLDLNSNDLLGSEMKALKNGLVEVTSLVKEADGTVTQYTFTVDENLNAVNTKINNNVVDLKKYIDAVEKAEKESNIGKNNLGSYYETFTPDSTGWIQLVDKIKSAGVELENVDKIIRHIDEVGQESFQVFSGLTRVTVGMDSDNPLYRKDTVLDAAGAIEEYRRRLEHLQKTAKNAFKGDDIAVHSFVADYNQIADLFAQIKAYSNKGIISPEDVTNLESMYNSFKTYLTNISSTLSSDGMFKDFADNVEQLSAQLSSMLSESLADISKLSDTEGSTIQEYFRQYYDVFSSRKNIQNKQGNPNQISKLLTKITDDMDKNSNMSTELRRDYEQLAQAIESFNGEMTVEQVRKYNTEFMKLHYTLVQSNKTGLSFIDSITKRLGDINVKWIAQLFSLHDWINYVRQTAGAVIQLDTALVDLKKTTSMTTEELNKFYFDSNKIARQMGVTTEEIISQAASWSRLGYSTAEASREMAELSSQFTSISPGMTTENSTDYLVSTMQAYGIAVDEVERKILDNINRIGGWTPKHMVTYGVLIA